MRNQRALVYDDITSEKMKLDETTTIEPIRILLVLYKKVDK